MSIQEPVEERPPTLLVHGDMPREPRDVRTPWLTREKYHPNSVLLVVTGQVAAATP